MLLPIAIFSRKGYVEYDGHIDEVILNPIPSGNNAPTTIDWRNINGTRFTTRVLNQQAPYVCGSCWAEAATGALSDRYAIATNNKLNINLAPQILLNFNSRTSGGSCNGGSALKAYEFMHKYGIVDDTCQPFVGLNWLRGFEVAAMDQVEDVQQHQCYQCMWNGNCAFVKSNKVKLYRASEFGKVQGEERMMEEIATRGPIACSLNSEAESFDAYMGGIITCPKGGERGVCDWATDHVVVITGYGVDRTTGQKYWIGRNSYGTSWGEGAGGGEFRLERGTDTLGIETAACAWAVPHPEDVLRAVEDFERSNNYQ